MAIQKNEVPPEKVKGLGENDEMVQFFVRVQVSWLLYTTHTHVHVYVQVCKPMSML